LRPPGIDRIDAGRAARGRATGVTCEHDVAVVDTGTASTSDLNVASGVITGDNNGATEDPNYHGTSVGGIMPRRDNKQAWSAFARRSSLVYQGV
jgi:subtilisin family serine protease